MGILFFALGLLAIPQPIIVVMCGGHIFYLGNFSRVRSDIFFTDNPSCEKCGDVGAFLQTDILHSTRPSPVRGYGTYQIVTKKRCIDFGLKNWSVVVFLGTFANAED